jgi:hypothetical protein
VISYSICSHSANTKEIVFLYRRHSLFFLGGIFLLTPSNRTFTLVLLFERLLNLVFRITCKES